VDIFNKEKIQELEKENKEIKKLLVDLNKKLIQLEANSEEWDDYKKWKELKDSFPKIEEMFKIKDLKRLVDRRNYLNNVLEETHKARLAKQIDLSSVSNPYTRSAIVQSMNDFKWLIDEIGNMLITDETEINKILKDIGKNKDTKLIEILKLYGIESDWILNNEQS
jgi:hypothetical protein